MRTALYTTLILMVTSLTVFGGDWYMEGGAVFRKSIGFDQESDSYANQLGIQAAETVYNEPSPSEPDRKLLYDDMSERPRRFDDGYVLDDPFTAPFGTTEQWSFNKMSQYDSGSGTLTFHVASKSWQSTDEGYRQTVGTDTETVLYKEEGNDAMGVSMRGGRVLMRRPTYWVAMQVGVNLYDRVETSLSGTPYAQTVTSEHTLATRTVQENWAYVYDASFGGAKLVDVRPQGSTGAPFLSVTPLSRSKVSVDDETQTEVLSSTQQRAVSTVRLDADLRLAQLTAGPRCVWEIHPKVSVGMAAYASVNLINISGSRTESFAWDGGDVIQAWQDSESDTIWAAGCGADLSITVHATERVSLTLQGGYDAVLDDSRLQIGPSEVKADLDSWTSAANVLVRL